MHTHKSISVKIFASKFLTDGNGKWQEEGGNVGLEKVSVQEPA